MGAFVLQFRVKYCVNNYQVKLYIEKQKYLVVR